MLEYQIGFFFIERNVFSNGCECFFFLIHYHLNQGQTRGGATGGKWGSKNLCPPPNFPLNFGVSISVIIAKD